MQSIIALSRHSSQRFASLAGYLSRQAKEFPALVGVELCKHCAAILDVGIAQP